MAPNKACPVVLRERDGETQILVFRHPAGDIQLVKGTIEPGEDPAAAAVRELAEESGIVSGKIKIDLGIWKSGLEDQVWAIFICETAELPDKWNFYCDDDGGLDLQFFWHSLNAIPGEDWHNLYRRALWWIIHELRLLKRL